MGWSSDGDQDEADVRRSGEIFSKWALGSPSGSLAGSGTLLTLSNLRLP